MLNDLVMDKVQALFDRLCTIAASHGRQLSGRQMLYAQRWLDAQRAGLLRRGAGKKNTGIVLAEADTGTGKTIGFALPLMAMLAMTGKRGAIGTSTHQLQRQMLHGDLARINQWLVESGHPPLKLAMQVGRQAFVSQAEVARLLAELSNDPAVLPEALEFLAELELWARAANEGKTSGLLADALLDLGYQDGMLPWGIQEDAVTLSASSPKEDRAAYDRHLAEADAANLVLVTHRRLTAAAAFRLHDMTKVDVLVVDEADQLRGAMESLLRFNVSLFRVGRVFDRLGFQHSRKALDELTRLVSDAYTGEEATPVILLPAATRKQITEQVEFLRSTVNAEFTAAEKAYGRMPALERTELLELLQILQRFVRYSEVGSKPGFFVTALSYSPAKHLPSLSVAPIYPGRLISELWKNDDSKLASVLLTAATLGDPGAQGGTDRYFRQVAFELGVNADSDEQYRELPLWGVYQPDRFGQMRFILPDPAAATPTRKEADEDGCAVLVPEWVAYAVRLVQEAASAGSRTLVLVRSFKEAALLAEALRPVLGTRLIEQVRGMPLKTAITQYSQDPAAVWISPTAWTGVDLPGLVPNLVIPRLPFVAEDTLSRALLTAYSLRTGEEVEKIVQARRTLTAKRLFRQGLGRGIRHASDRCTVYLGDPRFPVPSMNAHLLARAAQGKNVARASRQHGYMLEAIPARFRAGITSTAHPPRIFWDQP